MDPNARPLDEAQRQIDVLLQQQERLAPELYRDLALYLQVLREGLLHAVQQACFHLATQRAPERYRRLPQQRRQQLQRRLEALVQRCNTLLTVEQLMGLAAQQQRRDHRRRLISQQRLLQSLLESGDGATVEEPQPAQPTEHPSGDPSPDRPARAATEPGAGSVHLSLDLPVSADLFDRGLPGLPGLASGSEAPVEAASESTAESAADAEPASAPDAQLKLMQSLFQLASAELNGQPLPQPAGETPLDSPEPSEPEAPLAPFEDRDGLATGLPDPRVTASLLPRDPLLQLRWWGHFDRALRRRLRNLSHAVNVELLRVGLAQGLLPMSLLDAVLDGQLEALPAPANLLRLPLPMPEGDPLVNAMPAEVMALLLRSGDLEFEQPRLRSCRKRLEQRRRALRTMAKRYGSWQRRLQALAAEQQWFLDSAPPPPNPPAAQG